MKGKLLLSGLMAEDKGTFVFGRESAMSWWNPTAGTPILEVGLTLAMSRPTHRTSSKSSNSTSCGHGSSGHYGRGASSHIYSHGGTTNNGTSQESSGDDHTHDGGYLDNSIM